MDSQNQYLKLSKNFADETSEHIQEQAVEQYTEILVGRVDLREIRTFYRANPNISKTPFQDVLDLAAGLAK